MQEPNPTVAWAKAISEPLDRLDALLQSLPDLPGSSVRQRLRTFIGDLRDLTVNARGPRLLVVGRPGAGKTALAECLFGELAPGGGAIDGAPAPHAWHARHLPGVGAIELCDVPIEGPTLQSTATGDWEKVVSEQLAGGDVDAVLFVQGIEDRAYGPVDRAAMSQLWAGQAAWPGWFVVANRSDTVNPPGWKPPYDLAQPVDRKARAIVELVREIETSFGSGGPSVVPVCSYWDRTPTEPLDMRWNLSPLQDALYEALPLRARLVYARSSRHTQARLADRVIEEAALLTFAFGLNPLPLADMVPISVVQGVQVMLIMAIAGRTPDWPAATQFINRLGVTGLAALTGREFVRNLAKLVPGAGDVVSAGLATATTIALGETAKQVYTGQTGERDSAGTFEVLRRGWEKRLNGVRTESDLSRLFRQPGQPVRTTGTG